MTDKKKNILNQPWLNTILYMGFFTVVFALVLGAAFDWIGYLIGVILGVAVGYFVDYYEKHQLSE